MRTQITGRAGRSGRNCAGSKPAVPAAGYTAPEGHSAHNSNQASATPTGSTTYGGTLKRQTMA